MISVCSVKVIDPSIRQQICSLYRVTTFPDSQSSLRKPLVEKLRRERINSSIEQLKSLLGPEFLKQQPDSKLETADILEMTVCFLTQLQQQSQQQRRLLNHFNKLQSSSDKNLREADFSPLSSTVQTSITKDKSPVNSALWRPW
ncbi:transcription factor HES-5-like protein [Lates japonicus]|uniref:Transcription factor HES-5 n=1 Tax=Lates japonicus TaxID=270547 RepID=A0AAD3N8G6_LATJO|nr:transcription factor HES-5-like protein [Lates japonicus]